MLHHCVEPQDHSALLSNKELDIQLFNACLGGQIDALLREFNELYKAAFNKVALKPQLSHCTLRDSTAYFSSVLEKVYPFLMDRITANARIIDSPDFESDVVED